MQEGNHRLLGKVPKSYTEVKEVRRQTEAYKNKIKRFRGRCQCIAKAKAHSTVFPMVHDGY